jgi:hypothetical protein
MYSYYWRSEPEPWSEFQRSPHVQAGMDGFPSSWHSPLMHRRPVPRHFPIVFALAQILAIHGLLAAWGLGISALAGGLGASALFCMNSRGIISPEPSRPSGQPPHHDCAIACTAIAGPVPALTAGVLLAPPPGAGAVMMALDHEARPNLVSGLMPARGPPLPV